MNKKLTSIALSAAMLATIGMSAMFGGCAKETKEINISGSSSVSPVMQALAAEYEKTHDVSIIVTTSDSSTGITEAKEGKNDFGMASKKVSEEELTTVQIATDGIVLIVNKNSAVEDVDPAEVYELYANGIALQTTITTAITREEGSGTRDAFGDLIKDKDGNKLKNLSSLADCVSIQSSTGSVKETIKANSKANSIGYISLGSLEDTVKALKIKGVEATVANVKNGSYTLSRPFNIVYNTQKGLSAEAKDFLDFILSAEGQAVVTASGCIDIL